MLASRSAGVDSRGAVLGAHAQPPHPHPHPPHPQAPPLQLQPPHSHPHPPQPLHHPLHMPQLGAPYMPAHLPLLQYDNLVRPVAAHRYEQAAAAVDAADVTAATDRLFRQNYFRMRSEYEATAMFSPPDNHMWMFPPPPAPPPHQTSLSGANSHATHGVLRHPQARTSPPTSATSTRTPSGGPRDSPAPVNLSAPHKGAQAGFTYPMLGTTSLYAPSYAHPSMVGRTAPVTGSTATYSPPAASPAPIPAMMPLGPPSAPPRRRATVTMSTASTINLPPPSAPPPTSLHAPTTTSAPSLPAPCVPTPVSAPSSTPAPAPPPSESTQVIPPAVTKDLACFKRGARIRLASGEVRCVETMRAEDLVTSADPSLQSYAAKVIRLTAKPGGTIAVAMALHRTGENRAQFESEIEVNPEHPFFVYSQGWTSYNPERSSQLLGLKCHKLQIGDVCISLARRTQPTPATTQQSSTGTTSRSSGARHTNRKSTQPASTASIPQTSAGGNVSDAGSSANSSRKRRWSAPDQFEEDNKTLKTSH